MSAADRPARPNVVVVVADDLGLGDVGAYWPASKVPTPHLDRLAAEGMRFTDAHAPAAVCTPSRYGLLTGRYGWRTPLQRGVLSGYARPLIEPERPTLASLLRDAGYRTACIGKWHLGMRFAGRPGADPDFAHPPYHDRAFEAQIDVDAPIAGGPCDVGFDHFFGTPGCPTCHAPYAFVEDDRFVVAPTDYDDDPVYTSRPGMMAPGWSHRDVDPVFAERAAAWIEAQAAAGAPFFLYLAASAPHEPCVDELVPSFARGRSAAGPRGDLAWLYDWLVGQVVDALERAGVADDTLLVVTSDHGALPGDRVLGEQGEVLRDAEGEEAYRTYGHDPSAGWRGSKAHIWEGGHRVPLLARLPGRVAAGAVSDALVSLCDLLPTCTELAGIDPPPEAAPDGVSFAPVLLGRTDAAPRSTLVMHSEAGVFAVREGPWKLIVETQGSGGWPPPAGGPPKTGSPGQLYHLGDDPDETTNLYDARPDLVERLGGLLASYRASGRSVPPRSFSGPLPSGPPPAA
jgi:arylsulfatase A